MTLLPEPGMHCPTCRCTKPRRDRKLTADQVREIRQKFRQGNTVAVLRRSYGLSHDGIMKIVNRDTYKEIN